MNSSQLFARQCHHFLDYRNVTQATIERLRLVCRTWADLLRDKTSEFAVTDLESRHYTPSYINKIAIRVNINTGDIARACTYPTPPHCIFHPNGGIERPPEIDDERYFYTRIPNVKILIMGNFLMASLKYFKPLSNLVALSLDYDGSRKSKWHMKELSIYAPQLTHLQIRYLFGGSVLLSEKFTHYNLRYLKLEFFHSSEGSSSEKLVDWTFPLLQTFIIQGSVQPMAQEFVYGFITRHGKNLIGLDISYCGFHGPRLLSPFLLPSDLWEVCPSLHALGITSHHLLSKNNELLEKSRSTSACSSLGLLIDRFMFQFDFRPSQMVSVLKDLIRRWKIGKVVTAESWNLVQFNPAVSDQFQYTQGNSPYLLELETQADEIRGTIGKGRCSYR
jgi:hypothetical protein